MNLAKSKVVLKKINTLYESLELSEDVSKIEKDLLLDYVKHLYEIVLELPAKKNKKRKKTLDNAKNEQLEKIELEHSAPAHVEIIEQHTAAIPDKKEVSEKPAYEKISTPVHSSNGFHRSVAVTESQTAVEVKPAEVPVKMVAPEIENLFDLSMLNKSDYRFSQTPITDITKAMGINERMLLINLLFNKDQQDFNYVATKLNYFNSFDEASQYLKTEIAGKYDWGNVDKKDKAIEFIKLIKRKYVS